MVETYDALSLHNVLRPEILVNPYPFYQRLRAEDPVHWDEDRDHWVLTRHADVVAALRDPRFSAERVLPQDGGGADPIAYALSRQMLFLDPPDHTRLRTLVSKAFTPRVIEGMRPRVQAMADGLIDGVQGHGRMDLIADFAFPLPAIVIAGMLGVPSEDRDQFKVWSEDFGALLSGTTLTAEEFEAASTGVFSLMNYFLGIIEERRREPREDLLSGLVAAEEQGDKLATQELLVNLVLLLAAGHGTTTHLIGNGMLALLRSPEQLRLLRDDPSLIAGAVTELLRYDGPVQATGRNATEDLVIGGQPIRKGQHVVTVLGAANRDPAQFPDPDRLDVTRPEGRPVAFGYGIHHCLGAALARIEGQVAIGTLLRRLPDPRLETDAPEYMPSIIFRGQTSLPLAFG